MKRVLTAVAIMCFVATAAFAQGAKKLTVEIAPTLAVPVGDLSKIAGLGFGAAAIVNYPIMEKLVATGAAGYTYFLEKKSTTHSAIPIMVGAKYYFVPGVFAGAELGLHRWGWEVGGFSGSSNELTITPQIGYELGKLTVVGQYVYSGSHTQYIAARVAFPVWSN